MIQNDATYCMDEAMEAIDKINVLRVNIQFRKKKI